MIEGVKKLQPKGTMTVLSSDKPDQVNTLDAPSAVSPKDQEVEVKGKAVKLSVKPFSFNVVRVKML